jgi:hypothetical protein
MSRLIALITVASAVSLAASTSLRAQGGRPAASPRADGFSAVHCGADVAKSLVGGTMPNKPVAAIEAAHTDIKLEDVGGSDITESLFLGGWQMCGHEYQLLIRGDRIEDARQLPPHSRRQPAFLGACTLHDKRVDHVLAVLDNPAAGSKAHPPYSPDDTTSLAANAAWRVDTKARRLIGIAASGLRCPRGGIFTADGGT